MVKLCGEGLCGRVAGLLVVTGFAIALVFNGLAAIGGAALVVAAGVMLAVALEESVPRSSAMSDELPTERPSADHKQRAA